MVANVCVLGSSLRRVRVNMLLGLREIFGHQRSGLGRAIHLSSRTGIRQEFVAIEHGGVAGLGDVAHAVGAKNGLSKAAGARERPGFEAVPAITLSERDVADVRVPVLDAPVRSDGLVEVGGQISGYEQARERSGSIAFFRLPVTEALMGLRGYAPKLARSARQNEKPRAT